MKNIKFCKPTKYSLLLFPMLAISFASFANQHQHHQMADSDGNVFITPSKTPISIMGSHLHHKGGWMASYRFMTMEMEGLQTGTTGISSAKALEQYSMVPKDMSMNMHMLDLMYAPSDDITLMLMANFVDQEMTSTMKNMPMTMPSTMAMDTMASMNMSHDMSMDSSGLADVSFSALINGFNGDAYRSHFTLGVRLPLGDIDQTRIDMSGEDVLMGYPMQIGSETTNLLAGYTLIVDQQYLQFGSQFNYEMALENNDANYKPGDKVQWHNWTSYGVTESLSVSVRLSYVHKENYSGHDQRLNPMMMPSADPKQRGVAQFEWGVGASYGFTSGLLKNQQVSLEFSQPIEQDFDGMQLNTDWQAVLGWQISL